MNTDPLLRDNNGKQMRFHSQTETIDSLLDRMETKYSEDAEMPKDMRTDKEKNEEIIMDLRIWHIPTPLQHTVRSRWCVRY
jgi:hypothetical protein